MIGAPWTHLLARIGNMRTPAGHLCDYYADNLVNAAFFAAVSRGLRQSWFGAWSIALGVLGCSVCALSRLWPSAG